MLLPDVKRFLLLWEEGLLCRSCHQELRSQGEIDTGTCRRCVRRAYWLTRWFRKMGVQ